MDEERELFEKFLSFGVFISDTVKNGDEYYIKLDNNLYYITINSLSNQEYYNDVCCMSSIDNTYEKINNKLKEKLDKSCGINTNLCFWGPSSRYTLIEVREKELIDDGMRSVDNGISTTINIEVN